MNDTARASSRLEELCDAARSLPTRERRALVDAILQSLEPFDTELDRQWAEEAKDRIEAFERGEMEAYDLDEILGKYGPK